MKRQQLLLVGSGIVLVVLLFFFGKTNTPKKENTPASAQSQSPSNGSLQFSDILSEAKKSLTSDQNQRLAGLENAVVRGDVNEQKLHVFHQLARFWKDSAKMILPYAYYTAEASKLENSEKSLTFAAQLFVDNLLIEGNPPMQKWLATNAKDLLDRALKLNPNNDSSKIGIGACLMFGNISDNPMQGILTVREIVQKNPDNLYGQLVLGLGGKKSGQFDKAIEHFSVILKKQPNNLEAIFQIAECYELKGDKANAVKWYETGKKFITDQEIRKQIDIRINELK
ncbi:tetratricopeptide repeat protein [mine drainage metagenome]|uniref:Tetratricopeptide repeat protein n=1 Tax=mine drainage metagenome TaxID=410659 RepID=A0A1J5T789_9ZZZZ